MQSTSRREVDLSGSWLRQEGLSEDMQHEKGFSEEEGLSDAFTHLRLLPTILMPLLFWEKVIVDVDAFPKYNFLTTKLLLSCFATSNTFSEWQ